MRVHSSSSGLVYLPPLYSDHIAVRCSLRDLQQQQPSSSSALQGATMAPSVSGYAGRPMTAASVTERPLLGTCMLEDDPSTQNAQPQRKWRGLGSFLQLSATVKPPGCPASANAPRSQRSSDTPERQQQHHQQQQQNKALLKCTMRAQEPRAPATSAAATTVTDVVVVDDYPSDCTEDERAAERAATAHKGETGEVVFVRRAAALQCANRAPTGCAACSGMNTSFAPETDCIGKCTCKEGDRQLFSAEPAMASAATTAVPGASGGSLQADTSKEPYSDGPQHTQSGGEGSSRNCASSSSNSRSKRVNSNGKPSTKKRASEKADSRQMDLRRFFAPPKGQ